MSKTKIVYYAKDPFQKGVKYLAIQTESDPPYVWECWASLVNVPKLGDDMLLIKLEHALKLFEFKEVKVKPKK